MTQYTIDELIKKLEEKETDARIEFKHIQRKWYWMGFLYEPCCGKAMEVFQRWYRTSNKKSGNHATGCKYCGRVNTVYVTSDNWGDM